MRLRNFALLLAASLAVTGVYSVLPYTTALVNSDATIALSAPGDALLATPDFVDHNGLVVHRTGVSTWAQTDEEGEKKDSLTFSLVNNMSVGLEISIDWPEQITEHTTVYVRYPTFIGSGESMDVLVEVWATRAAKPREYRLPLDISGQWEGGNVHLQLAIPVVINRAVTIPPGQDKKIQGEPGVSSENTSKTSPPPSAEPPPQDAEVTGQPGPVPGEQAPPPADEPLPGTEQPEAPAPAEQPSGTEETAVEDRE